MSSLKEAFQEFDELDDVVYDIDNKDDLDRLKKSLDDDEDDLENIEKIVDINATDEEDLEQSYVGKLLLYCPFCHTIHYANKEDIVESEDDPEYVNVGEQCPECSQIEGFEVIGEVAPVDGAEPDTEQGDETGEEPEEENEIDLETEFGLPDEDEDEFEESFHRTKKSSFLERLVDNDCKKEDVDFDDNDDEIEIDEKVGAVLPKVRRKVKENLKAKKSLKENLTEAPVYGLEPRYDARKSFYGKAQVDTGDKGDKNKLYSYDTLVAEIKDGKPVVYGTYSQTTLRHIKEWLKQLGFKAENSKQILADYGAKRESCKEAKKLKEVDGQDKYFTQKGKDALSLSKKLGLSKYYDPMSGIYEIPKSEYDSVKDKVDKLLSTNKNYKVTDGDDTDVSDYKGLMFIELDESCGKNLNEEVQDEAYEIAEWVYEKIKDKDTVTKDDFEEQVALACRELYGIDNVYENVDEQGKVEINGKTFDVDELLEGDIRGILGYKGWATNFSNGDLTTKEIDESLTEGNELPDYYRQARDEWNRAVSDVRKYNVPVNRVSKVDASGKTSYSDEPDFNAVPEKDREKARQSYDSYRKAVNNLGTAQKRYYSESLKEDSERDNLRATIKALDPKRQPRLKLVKKDAPKKDAHKNDACKDEECKKKELDEALLVTCDFSDYRPWSGAVENYRVIEQEDKLDELENLLEECYPEGISMVEINDILWFDWEWVFDQLGISEEEEDFGESDEIDENLFDNLINKYCTRVYENVKDYRTTAGYTQGENLVLEGLLSFKSGKTANTKFIFEKKMVKDNQVKYVGLNESFSKSKKAFTLNCKIDNKKIISESLTYNYKVKVNNEKKAVYGSIKNN